jgi:hypothetical protein
MVRLTISEALAQVCELVGEVIAVDGILLVGEDSRLVASPDEPTSACIVVPHELTAQVRRKVPPLGGGPNMYHEDATICGAIVDSPPRFSSVRSITIRRRNRTYEISNRHSF